MSIIKNWIICILIGAFIVNIVDMILPKSKLKPYINLVCNFIFIFIVISPIVGFLSEKSSLEDKILKSMNEYNEKYIQSSREILGQNKNLNLNKEYENNLKSVLELKLDEYGYELENIDFDGTDIESLKIKEKADQDNNLNLENQNRADKNLDSKEKVSLKNQNNETNDKEVFKSNITKENNKKDNLKGDLIKILDVSIDKIEID